METAALNVLSFQQTDVQMQKCILQNCAEYYVTCRIFIDTGIQNIRIEYAEKEGKHKRIVHNLLLTYKPHCGILLYRIAIVFQFNVLGVSSQTYADTP